MQQFIVPRLNTLAPNMQQNQTPTQTSIHLAPRAVPIRNLHQPITVSNPIQQRRVALPVASVRPNAAHLSTMPLPHQNITTNIAPQTNLITRQAISHQVLPQHRARLMPNNITAVHKLD